MLHRLERSTFIPRPRSTVFAFFADVHNLERITPPFLGFRILTPDPIVMQAGTVIDYRLRFHGIPVRWRTLIAEFHPDRNFIDLQIAGPYRSCHHRHEFADAPGGTEMHDQVDYEMPFGLIGEAARRLFVRSSLEEIFDHRSRVIASLI